MAINSYGTVMMKVYFSKRVINIDQLPSASVTQAVIYDQAKSPLTQDAARRKMLN